MTDEGWIRLALEIGALGVAVGTTLGAIATLKARVRALEGSARRQGQRLGEHDQQLAVVSYKLFGRAPTRPPDQDPQL